jgi:hypothetical protein
LTGRRGVSFTAQTAKETTMSRTLPRSLLIGIALAIVIIVAAIGTARAQTFQFADVVGWWSAEPEFAGETSRIVLHFLEENGKQTPGAGEARVTARTLKSSRWPANGSVENSAPASRSTSARKSAAWAAV